MKSLTGIARVLLLGAMVVFSAAAPAQQAYPSRPIHMIVPFPPGGGNDLLARIVAKQLGQAWNQAVIVDNRPGGNTIIGSSDMVKAAPDGYTIMLTNGTHVINSSLFAHLPYDAIKDFAPVATVAGSEYMLVTNPSVPADNLPQLIALAKSEPGKLNYASSGIGTSNHLAGALFCIMTKTNMTHIPYEGGGPALTDLIGGHVQVSFQSPDVAIPLIKKGMLKGIAISGDSRLASLPDVPTFAQAGLHDFDVRNWYGILAPAATPKAIVDRLSVQIGKILAAPDVREQLVNHGLEPLISTPEQFAMLMKNDKAKWAKVIKETNIKLQD